MSNHSLDIVAIVLGLVIGFLIVNLGISVFSRPQMCFLYYPLSIDSARVSTMQNGLLKYELLADGKFEDSNDECKMWMSVSKEEYDRFVETE